MHSTSSNKPGKLPVDYQAVAAEVRAELASVYATAIPSFSFEQRNVTNFYYYYPFFFWDEFPDVSFDDVKVIAVSARLYLDHICTLDSFVDGADPGAVHLPLLSGLLHERALTRIATLFHANSAFWNYLWDFHREYAAAVIFERRLHFGRIQAFEDGEFFRLAKGKSALSKAAIAALAALNGTTDSQAALFESQDNFNAALQMLDDIKDWKVDLKKRRFSYLVTTGVIGAGLGEAVLRGSDNNLVDDLGRHLYYSGLMEQAIGLASDWSDRAIACASGYRVEPWMNLCRDLKSRIDRLSSDFGGIRSQTVLKSGRERGIPDSDEMTRSAARFILEQRASGYPEAYHAMNFAVPNQVRSAEDEQTGIVFQRAIVTDVLLDLRDAGRLENPDILGEETNKLANDRLTDVPGGWSYFPELRDLPPDADDLGQILQVFVRSCFSRTGSLVEDPIRLLFEKCAHPDGSFETWIVDSDSNDPRTQAMLKSIRRSWGSGPDVEVIANLAYGLTLYDAPRFHSRIDGAIAFIETRQQPSGRWIPSWYWSSYYGTYVATRLIAAARPRSASLDKVWTMLPAAQREDGGFGDESSTPLETALALLTWALRPEGVTENPGLVESGLRYLELTCGQDGSWDPTPFIKMETDRASRPPGAKSRRVLTYKSRTITTAYVLKCLLALSRAPSIGPGLQELQCA